MQKSVLTRRFANFNTWEKSGRYYFYVSTWTQSASMNGDRLPFKILSNHFRSSHLLGLPLQVTSLRILALTSPKQIGTWYASHPIMVMQVLMSFVIKFRRQSATWSRLLTLFCGVFLRSRATPSHSLTIFVPRAASFSEILRHANLVLLSVLPADYECCLVSISLTLRRMGRRHDLSTKRHNSPIFVSPTFPSASINP